MKRLLLFAAIVLGCTAPLSAQQAEDAVRQLQKFVRAYRLLDRYYVDTTAMQPLVEGAIEGMLSKLDPHSAYLGIDQMREAEASMSGEFSGIGIEFMLLRDTVTVAATVAGGPAERVGMLPDDRIVRIDTLDAVGLSRGDVPKYLRGKSGTKVAVEVVRRGVANGCASRSSATRSPSTRSTPPIRSRPVRATSRLTASAAPRCASSARRGTACAVRPD